MYGNSILDQRCIFHKLKHVCDKVRRELKGKEHKETRKTLMEQAALMYRTPYAEGARQRLCDWSQKWRSQAPDAVATLEQDVEHTLVF